MDYLVVVVIILLIIIYPQHFCKILLAGILLAVVQKSSSANPMKAPYVWSNEKVDKLFEMLSEDELKPGVRAYLTQRSPSDEAVMEVMDYFEGSIVDAGLAPMYNFEEDIRFANNNFESFKNHRNYAMELFDRAYQNLELNHYDQELLDTDLRRYNNLLDLARNASTYEKERSALYNAKNFREEIERLKKKFSNIPDLPPVPSPRFSGYDSSDSDEYYSALSPSPGYKRGRSDSDEEGDQKRPKMSVRV